MAVLSRLQRKYQVAGNPYVAKALAGRQELPTTGVDVVDALRSNLITTCPLLSPLSQPHPNPPQLSALAKRLAATAGALRIGVLDIEAFTL